MAEDGNEEGLSNEEDMGRNLNDKINKNLVLPHS